MAGARSKPRRVPSDGHKPPSKGGQGFRIWHFAVPEELFAQIDALAQAEGRSRPQQVMWIVREHLRRAQEQRRRAEDEAPTVAGERREARGERVGAA